MKTSTQFIQDTESIATVLMNKIISTGVSVDEAMEMVLDFLKSDDFEKIFAPMILVL
jgi:hypothetical protein